MDSQGTRAVDLNGSVRGIGNVVDVEAEEEETSDDDDDLDKPVVRRFTKQLAQTKTHGTALTTKLPPLKPSASSLSKSSTAFKPPSSTSFTNSNKIPSEPSIIRSKPPSSVPKAAPPKPLDDDGFIRPSNPQTDAIRRKMQARREKEQEERKIKKERTMDVDEIPIFLV